MPLFLLHKVPKLGLPVKVLYILDLNTPCQIIFPQVVEMSTSASCVSCRLISTGCYYSVFIFAHLIDENGILFYFDFLPISCFICSLAICISL